MFQREGHTYAEAQDMANEISMDKDLWLRTLLEKELGISMDETTNPTKDALVMGSSFIVAAIVPIVPYLFLEGTAAISVSITAALCWACWRLAQAKAGWCKSLPCGRAWKSSGSARCRRGLAMPWET